MGIYSALHQLHTKGEVVEVRGLKTKELTDFRYCLPPRQRFQSFDHRKLKLDYVKQEFVWYLRGDKFDISIKNIASMWDDLINTDGSINSNYGYYIFNQQTSPGHASNFARCVETLVRDKMSRRAAIMILDNGHLNSVTKDYPCTAYLNFLIRDNQLIMMVRMRSQDAIYGMGNDAPFFSFVQELMYVALKPVYPELEMGPYSHVADSFHVYERHFEMLEKIIDEPSMRVDFDVTCPHMSINTPRVIDDMLKGYAVRGKDAFVDWLITRENDMTLFGPEYKNDN